MIDATFVQFLIIVAVLTTVFLLVEEWLDLKGDDNS